MRGIHEHAQQGFLAAAGVVREVHLGGVNCSAGAAAAAGGLFGLGVEGLWDLGACAVPAEAPAVVRAHQRPIRRLYAPLCIRDDIFVDTHNTSSELGTACKRLCVQQGETRLHYASVSTRRECFISIVPTILF